MGRVKEAVLASLPRPIVSSVSAGILAAPHFQSRQCAMVSIIACFFSLYIPDIYTRIYIPE